MADVFISYKSERRPAISHLARVIENYGYSVWFDYALMSGGSFSAQIERELRAACAVIVVWCSMSVRTIEGKTNWVVEEADLAKNLGTYLPVWLEPVDLPLGFRMADVIDIADWNGDPRSHDLDRLINQISIKVQRDPAIKYKSLVAQSEEVWRSGHAKLAAYPLDKQGAQLAARNREREQREKAEAEQIAENARREEAAQLAAQQALAEAQARLEAEQRLRQEQEAADALAKAEQERLARVEEEERQQKALDEAAAKLREEQRLKDEAEAARKAEQARLEAERLEEHRRQEEAERQRLAELKRQHEEQRAARAAARVARQRAMGERVRSATSKLGTFAKENRVPLLGLVGTVGVVSLVLALASLGIGQGMLQEEEPTLIASGSGPKPGDAREEPTNEVTQPPAALALTGIWTLQNIPCEQANADNGRQQLGWTPGEGWTINGVNAKGSDNPEKDGSFKIDGLLWRIDGDKLKLSVPSAPDNSFILFNRCQE